jgi:hypothetical protein
MIIQSIKPTNIPNCQFWWDFSDKSTINQGLGGASELGSITVILDKIYGVLLGDTGMVGPSLGTLPVYKNNAINGLGVAYFGATPSHIGTYGYTDCLCTDGLIPPYNPDNGERTIFIVQQSMDTTSYGMTISTNDALNSTFSGLNFLPGTFGCILNITSQVFEYASSTGSTSYWDSYPSYINVVKYKGGGTYGASYAVCNFTPSVGASYNSSFYPNNDINKCHIIDDTIGKPNLITIRSYDCTPTYSTFIDSYCEVSSSSKSMYQSLSGVVYDGIYQTGIRYGKLYLGNTGVTGNKLSGYCGYIGEIIYYSRRLSDSETNQVQQYLKKKWGL